MEGRKRSKGVNIYRGIDVKFAFSRIVIPFGGGDRATFINRRINDSTAKKNCTAGCAPAVWIPAGCVRAAYHP